jgi:hypothetical protein
LVADAALFFAPLDEAIHTHFLPSLLGLPSTEIDGDYRQLLTHSGKMGGLAIRNPMDAAPHVHLASIVATLHLTASLVQAATRFDLGMHWTCANEAGLAAWRDRLQDEEIFLDRQDKDNPSVARRNRWNCVAGAWLSVFPNRLNSTGLSADEWHDNIRLRYNHSPLDMPTTCDGCGARITVEHALLCKTGGLVHIRHDDVADEWRHLYGTALSPGQVEREPRIFSSVSRRVTVAAGDSTISPSSTPPADTLPQPAATEERGDASCHGWFCHSYIKPCKFFGM